MNHSQWQLLPPAPSSLTGATDLPPLLIHLLYHRGITEPAQIEPFLAGDERLLADPFSLPDMERAVARVYRALLSGEAMAVYGDFDADGITGTVLLVQGLRQLGGQVIAYIPHRHEEGYGLNHAALDRLRNQGISLVVTVDCGITGHAEVKRAQGKGLDMIITDHHSVPSTLPPALANVNPKRVDSRYPFPDLAGAGVAFKLLQALFQALGRGLPEQFLDLVALGTVADMVALVGENRYLVRRGLQLINRTERLGLREMISQAKLQPGNISSEHISWALGPRLNATGRLHHAMVSYQLLSTDSPEEAHQLASEVEAHNAERQRLTEEVLAKAKEQLGAVGADLPLLMVGGGDYPAGVLGVVAGKLVDEFYRPTIVLHVGGRESVGSARSIQEFSVIAALRQCGHLLLRFGGHPMAAGFSVLTKNLGRLQECLLSLAREQLDGLDLRPLLAIDAEMPLSRLNGRLFPLLQQLAPFGQGNPAPTFLSRGVKVVDCRPLGSKGDHLSLKIRQDDIVWPGVAFGLGNLLCEVGPRLDIVYNLEVDSWGGEERLRLNILDFAAS